MNWLSIVLWVVAVLIVLASLPLLALGLNEEMRVRRDVAHKYGDGEVDRWLRARIWEEHQRMFPRDRKRARVLSFFMAYLAVLLVALMSVFLGVEALA